MQMEMETNKGKLSADSMKVWYTEEDALSNGGYRENRRGSGFD